MHLLTCVCPQYYHVDQWVSQCNADHSATPAVHTRECTPVHRISGTALTDFDPRTTSEQQPRDSRYPLYNGANGGGSLTYPGAAGPLASNRLIAIADGIGVLPALYLVLLSLY